MLGPADEVLVVDNASRSRATQEVASRHPFVRYVHEPTPGLDVARNTGVRASKGSIIAFCDDDISVGPQWLSRIKAAFLDDEIMAVTGPVVPASLDTEAEYVFETRWGFNRGFTVRTFGPDYFAAHRARGVPVWELGAGANMAFRRSVFAAVGGFDERLDVGAAGCSGDSEMWYRILAAGFRCRYEPSAISCHQHRRDLPALRSQIFHYMRGHAAALLIQFERTRHWGNMRRLLLGLPMYYAGRILRQAVRPNHRRNAMLGSEIRGWASGIVYYLGRARQSPPVVVPDAPPGRADRESQLPAAGQQA
jgi:GT2 family glycosyltransferase